MTNTTDIAVDKQALSILSEQLNDEKNLSDYNIQKKSIVYLYTSGKMLIFLEKIKSEGKKLPFVVEDSDTIESFKDQIADREG